MLQLATDCADLGASCVGLSGDLWPGGAWTVSLTADTDYYFVLDGWLFGFIPETEDCPGWHLGQMQTLTEKIEAEWDKYGNLPSRLPPELMERHTALNKMAVERAREKGWDPELGEDE
ncbi:MAG: hypothetical protein CVU23_10050 [Betaproteobacteria bacterium HGW-Betaproteobacteria-17]|nr:MAG: hypothetical protein CVU23_10050 [Betaproteobacteria bacterium HGW-Betaproteobacteria-17]